MGKIGRLVVIGLAFMVVFIGCLPVMRSSLSENQQPIAIIDSVTPAEVAYGDRVTFVGHGVDADGSIVAYVWKSSVDGELGKSASLWTSSLSQGTHTVWFKVQDDKGLWSAEVPVVVIVAPHSALKPKIKAFTAEPPSVTEGNYSVLSWNVSGASVVTIEPGIGSVPSTSSRAVSPARTTTYLLMASNDAGTVSTTVEVAVVSVSTVYRVESYSVAAEDGQVRWDEYVGQEPEAGDTQSGISVQAFLSFDISMIPRGAVIKSAYLDLSAASVFGDPFKQLGLLRIYECQYTVLSSKHFVGPVPVGTYLDSLSLLTGEPIRTDHLVSAVQERVKEGSPRFQVRLQFDEAYCCSHNRQADYVAFWEGKPRLIIEYQKSSE